jgi:FkbM family methyltransferase
LFASALRLLGYLKWRFGLTPESRSRRALERVAPPVGAVALDCGANVGVMTAALARQGATVHAFEPNPHAFGVLAGRFHKAPHVVCHNAAVGCGAGRMPLFLHELSFGDEVLYSNGSSLLSDKPNVSPDRSIEVEVVNLAEFIRGLQREVAVMKMDIEGAEVSVLEHLIATDTMGLVREAFIETHENKIPSLADRTARLKAALANYPQCRVHWDWV